MKFTILPGNELGPDLLSAWQELQKANPELASPFFCPEFMAAVSSARDDVENLIIEDSGKIVAFFPFQRNAGNIGSPVGGCLSDYHGLICTPNFTCEPVELLKACNLSAWDFDHLVAGQAFFQRFHHQLTTSPQIDLSAGFDAYMADCHAARAERIKLRRLERDLGPVRIVQYDANLDTLDQVLRWKSEQYSRGQVEDLFSVEWVKSVINSIHHTSNKNFSGILSTLYAGDTLVAGHFGMRAGHVWHYWFPAYPQKFSKYSPGLILLIKMAETGCDAGLTLIDLGKGQSLYKDRFKNAEAMLAEGSVERFSFSTARRQFRRRCRALLVNTPIEDHVRKLVRYLRRAQAR